MSFNSILKIKKINECSDLNSLFKSKCDCKPSKPCKCTRIIKKCNNNCCKTKIVKCCKCKKEKKECKTKRLYILNKKIKLKLCNIDSSRLSIKFNRSFCLCSKNMHIRCDDITNAICYNGTKLDTCIVPDKDCVYLQLNIPDLPNNTECSDDVTEIELCIKKLCVPVRNCMSNKHKKNIFACFEELPFYLYCNNIS